MRDLRGNFGTGRRFKKKYESTPTHKARHHPAAGGPSDSRAHVCVPTRLSALLGWVVSVMLRDPTARD